MKRLTPSAWVCAFAGCGYVLIVAFASFRLFRQQQLAEQEPVFIEVLVWQALVYALWVPVAAAVWLLYLRSKSPLGPIRPYVLIGIVAVLIHTVFATAVDIGFSEPGGADLVSLAAERAQLGLLSFCALALTAIAATFRQQAREESANAACAVQALEAARERLAKMQFSCGSGPERLMVSAGSKRQMVPLDEVEWFGSAGNYVVVNWRGREGLVRETLQSMEERLDPQLFARSHRSTIVNLAMVQSAQSLSDGSWRLAMASGTELVVSRTHREAVLQRLDHSAVRHQ